jgi:cytochrome c-type biogenesis protein CcmE
MKTTHILGIIVIAIAIGAILYTLGDSSTYANFTVAANNAGKEYHVVGKLEKSKPFEYNPQVNANLFTFFMIDNNGLERKVMFNGSKPQDFEKSEQIVVVGKMLENGDFACSKILMKCPSKYNDPNSKEMKEFNATS